MTCQWQASIYACKPPWWSTSARFCSADLRTIGIFRGSTHCKLDARMHDHGQWDHDESEVWFSYQIGSVKGTMTCFSCKITASLRSSITYCIYKVSLYEQWLPVQAVSRLCFSGYYRRRIIMSTFMTSSTALSSSHSISSVADLKDYLNTARTQEREGVLGIPPFPTSLAPLHIYSCSELGQWSGMPPTSLMKSRSLLKLERRDEYPWIQRYDTPHSRQKPISKQMSRMNPQMDQHSSSTAATSSTHILAEGCSTYSWLTWIGFP